MTDATHFVGLDVHKKTIAVAVVAPVPRNGRDRARHARGPCSIRLTKPVSHNRHWKIDSETESIQIDY